MARLPSFVKCWLIYKTGSDDQNLLAVWTFRKHNDILLQQLDDYKLITRNLIQTETYSGCCVEVFEMDLTSYNAEGVLSGVGAIMVGCLLSPLLIDNCL